MTDQETKTNTLAACPTLTDVLADVLRTGKQATLTKAQLDSFYSEFSNGIKAQTDAIRHNHITGYASARTLMVD